MASRDELRVGVCGALGRMGRVTCAAVTEDPDLVLTVAVDPGFGAAESEPGTKELASEELVPGAVTADRVSSSGGGPAGSKLGPGVRCFPQLEVALAEGGVEVMVDFTVPAAVKGNVLACLAHRVPVVVGTTGLSSADLEEIARRAEESATAVLVAPNFALGAVLMMKAAQVVAEHMQACEIIELHHDRKLDVPSGTSKLTKARIEDVWRARGHERQVPIHSVRLPGLVAHQEVIFGGLGETLSIRHDSLSRESFMPGVLLAIKRVRSLQGLVVGLENIL